MAAAASQGPWSPYDSLTTPPTNLKEAIDWVLRVTGRDGKKNGPVAAAKQTPPQFGCLCFFAKAVKDLLYDAKDPGSPGPSPKRYWDDILLPGEQSIVKPVLTDLGLLSAGSTGAASTTCAGGTEVIKALIDQLALGLQKWVGWQEGDTCCLGQKNEGETMRRGSKGIGRECGGCGYTAKPVPCSCQCCSICRPGTSTSGSRCGSCTADTNNIQCCKVECQCCKCVSNADDCRKKGCGCYLSAYSKTTALWTKIVNSNTGSASSSTVNPVKAAHDVHLLARILLGSVCLIWSGLSQLGFLTGGGKRWKESSLHSLEHAGDNKGLASFMAAMGYDLDRLNGSGPGKGNGEFVHELLSGQEIKWKEFQGDSTSQKSVAEYYSSIYGAVKETKTETLCEKYPLLVLHILASGYFRAGSAGANKVTVTAKEDETDSAKKPRNPRTIREILYWLSALPYSQGYKGLVDRMQQKYPRKEGDPDPQKTVDQIELHNDSSNSVSTTLKKDHITHYLLAACGYCPLVLIGIQGTIEKEVKSDAGGGGGGGGSGSSSSTATDKNKCPNHKENPKSKRCIYKEDNKTTAASTAPAPGGQQLKEGEVCYGGYHLDVSKFGPLHGMYANGLFGFQMDGSPAQCLDQLRVYVYHCFYQLYFLRKQCGVGVENGAVLGWKSCRYGSGVYWSGGYSPTNFWLCNADGQKGNEHTQKCGLQDGAGGKKHSPLMCFLCDGLYETNCKATIGKGNIDEYPSIETHWTRKEDNPEGHYEGAPKHCPVPMGWKDKDHFKDLKETHKTLDLTPPQPGSTAQKYPAHCTGNTLSHLLEYYCDPVHCHGTLVVLLRLLACITPTVPRTLGDLFGFYYYIVYIGGQSGGGEGVHDKLKSELQDVRLSMLSYGDDAVVSALTGWSNGKDCSGKNDTLKCLYKCDNSGPSKQCCPYLSPLSGQQYGQLSPAMAGTYLSWLVYLIEGFHDGLEGLKQEFMAVDCKNDGCQGPSGAGTGCGDGSGKCTSGTHGTTCSGGRDGVCKCPSVVSCTGVLPVLYKYGFGYGDVETLHKTGSPGGAQKKCHDFLETLNSVKDSGEFKNLTTSINQLIYTTRLPWIFVLTVAWLVAVLYLAFGAIWPLDWTHMRSHCRGWFRKGSLSPWEILMVGKKKGRSIVEYFECICGLAAAVTDLLQSVELEYHGYQGETKATEDNKGATQEQVKEHLNGLFSLVQGLGGTAVVRTYIDQLAQVLSALVGWSRIVKCTGGGDGRSGCKGTDECKGGSNGGTCKYLDPVQENTPCSECKCMKWSVTDADGDNKGHHLGRKCTRCSDEKKKDCQCSGTCSAGKECKCAKEGKCCKCCCNSGCGNCKRECSCIIEDGVVGRDECNRDSYMSAYPSKAFYQRTKYVESKRVDVKPYWKDVESASNRHQCARILLGSVCLIWSALTYMYWTGKYAKTSPRWNNHILDGSGLDDGTLSQWLQALGFPRDMLNDKGPDNRLDKVIWNGLSDKLLLGFAVPKGLFSSGVHDDNENTARRPAGMNYPGLVHTIHRDSFNKEATVFPQNGTGSSTTDTNMHKYGALFKLYILSCAYFTGLQKKSTESATASTNNTTPRTIREILYWLSALPYSPAYPEILKHGKKRLTEVLKKPDGSSSTNNETQLKFYQDKRPAPITVGDYNLFAHFQAVTQYCPLVLIGIQGGLGKSTDSTKEPAIHALYANTECRFTYPTVSIQAYNQVVHYIRALFYQLYFLRKQCAMKVALGGKWRECRYGHGVVSHGVISWMCLGCNPMEHDRKSRVEKVKEGLKSVPQGGTKDLPGALKEVLEKIGDVVVQLGNAQEALEGKKKEAIEGVKRELEKAKDALEKVKDGLDGELEKAKTALEALTNGGSGALHTLVDSGDTPGSLHKAANGKEWEKDYSGAKDRISAAISGVYKALEGLLLLKDASTRLDGHKEALLDATSKLKDICSTPKCHNCGKHSKKCGQEGKPTMCTQCGNMTTTGVPSPLQAFLEDRLPGFSCDNTMDALDKQEADRAQKREKDAPPASELVYPSAASHLGHCNGSGQCCPLPMGFRNQFYSGIRDCTGQRLYGILYFFSNENMMQSCVYTLVRVTAALSATTPQVLGDVFGFFRGGVGNKEEGMPQKGDVEKKCDHDGNPSGSYEENKNKYFCGWCASGLREEVKEIEWIQTALGGKNYRESVGTALIGIKGDKGDNSAPAATPSALSTLTKHSEYLSPLTGELYTAVSATFGGTYLSWVLYLSDALEGGLKSLSDAFQQIECRGCTGCDPNKCKKGHHGETGGGQCGCQSIVSCTGVLPVLYRHGFSYGNPFNLEGYRQGDGKTEGDYSIDDKGGKKHCHEFLDSLSAVIDKNKQDTAKNNQEQHPLTNLLSQVGKLQYDIRLPWIFVLAVAWLVAVLYLAFGAIWPLDWTHMRSHWLRGGAHQWQCMWYKVMTGRKGMVVLEGMEYFGRR